MIYFKRFLNKYIYLGISEQTNNSEIKKIKLFNGFVLTWYIIGSYLIIRRLFEKEIRLDYIFGHLSILFVLILAHFLHTKKHHLIARVIYLFCLWLVSFIFSNFIAKGELHEFFYAITPLIALIFIDNKYVNLAILLGSIVLFALPNYFFNIYPRYILNDFVKYLWFVIFYVIVNYFKRLNFISELRLKEKSLELEKINDTKNQFYTNISHEFRTPLTLISGPVQKQLKREDLSDDDRHNFEMISRNSNRLLSLVDQLLDISKIETGNLKLKVSKSEIMSFIGSLCDSFKFSAKQKQINYITYTNKAIIDTYFDKDIIEKIVANLLSNAIKYTPNNGSVVCNATVKKNELHFTVKNTGKGLSAKEIAHIFERFYQINENKQGVGIGLALVKELVALHKGSISVESTPNEWTTFTVVLPVTKESFKKNEIIQITSPKVGNNGPTNNNLDVKETKTPNIETNLEPDGENPILLVVDDNADVRTYLTNIFTENYTVIGAKNGQQGIDVALEEVPDIIISDIMMPVKNGIDLCNNLKVDERTSHIPIILLTAKAGDQNEIEGIETGADDYVTKPFNEELLKLRVEKLIESRRKLQERYSQEVILRPKNIAITSIDEQFLERLQKVLDQKLVESSFNVEEFSKVVGMSRMQLHRKLKALTGLSATEFVRSQRLKLAAQLLKKSEINVSQVGYSVGFNDHAYFSKCFKEMYHCTPSEYIKTA